jgi:hypothetical protein
MICRPFKYSKKYLSIETELAWWQVRIDNPTLLPYGISLKSSTVLYESLLKKVALELEKVSAKDA